MIAKNLMNIHWMKQDKLKALAVLGRLYTNANTNGLFIKIQDSNIMLHSAIELESVWVNKSEVIK